MSKELAVIPRGEITRIAVYAGRCRETLAQARAWAERERPGERVYLLNGGTWSAPDRPDPWLVSNGQVLARADWSSWGFGWETGPDIAMDSAPERHRNFISCVPLLTPWDGMDAPLRFPAEMGGVRGRSALALAGDKLVLYCSGDGTADAKSPVALREELHRLGAETAIMLDGGGSSQCDFDGRKITGGRRVQNVIVVWRSAAGGEPEKGSDTMKKVVLDPGHGVETAGKRSPDGTYREYEFTLDLAGRLKTLLERHGVAVTLTRADAHDVSLARRVQIANDIKGLDLFVSLHSNAAGSGAQWMNARGFEVHTSAAGDTAGRNIAAKKILARAQEAGLTVRGLVHNGWYVVRHTNAPAVLIEHLFHDNKEDAALLKDSAFRDRLAEVDAKGVLDYLGVAWQEEPEPEAPPAPSDWAAESWEKAVAKGLFDGTSPQGALTREQAAVLLDRLGLL